MTLHNAWEASPLPKTIKTAAFTQLTESEVKALRTYKDLNDANIESGEVFLYGANVQVGLPEGDDFQSGRQVSTAAGAYNTARRTSDKQLVQANGRLTTVEVKKTGINVYWLDPTVSPNQVMLVQAKAI